MKNSVAQGIAGLLLLLYAGGIAESVMDSYGWVPFFSVSAVIIGLSALLILVDWDYMRVVCKERGKRAKRNGN